MAALHVRPQRSLSELGSHLLPELPITAVHCNRHSLDFTTYRISLGIGHLPIAGAISEKSHRVTYPAIVSCHIHTRESDSLSSGD